MKFDYFATKFDDSKLPTYNCQMFIQRDMTERLLNAKASVQLVVGPRQCGKSTLLYRLGGEHFREVTFDDLQLRVLANRDPVLFLDQFTPPILLDEVQYVPNLFPEIKRYVDQQKRKRLETNEVLSVLFRLTGSNQWLMDKNIKESLAGRANYFYLNTLSVHEIKNAFPQESIPEILFRGGWPELYVDRTYSPMEYLNDYIRSYIEKDIVLSAGVQKQDAFHVMLGLLAARTGMLLDYTSIARDAGIQAITVKEWVSLLERSSLVYCLQPYANNLNKRLTKTPKLYFLDTGLAVRLQGWQEQTPLMRSPQVGPLFETLVFAEIMKFIQNHGKQWQLYFWRTKEGEEIDFLIVTEKGRIIILDAKMSTHGAQAVKIPKQFQSLFPEVQEIILVTLGGERLQLSSSCATIPISELHDFLMALESTD